MTATKAVVPIRASQQLAKTGPKIPRAVVAGLTDLTIAFQTGARPDEDRGRFLQLCAKVIEPFHEQIVVETLAWMLTNNPRNPFAPTPMDLAAACKKCELKWRRTTLDKYGLQHWPYSKRVSEAGGFDTIVVPTDLEVDFIREHLETVGTWEASRVRDVSDYRDVPVLAMRTEQFEAIPTNAFPPGAFDTIVAKRAEYRTYLVEREARIKADEDRRLAKHGRWIDGPPATEAAQ